MITLLQILAEYVSEEIATIVQYFTKIYCLFFESQCKFFDILRPWHTLKKLEHETCNRIQVRWKILFYCIPQFVYESKSERIIEIGPHLPKLS